MEDIYGNLDNYEEDNVIDELKNENKELKFKLEDYALTLSNLQKDFDKLSSEYKKLELNYSSLLKTAKAEIERKTRIITNLNLEKDQLVLNALQKRGRFPPNHYKKNHNKENSQQTEPSTVKDTDSKKLKDDANVQISVGKNEQPSALNNERKNAQDKTTLLSGPAIKLGSDVKEKETKPIPAEDPNRYRDKYKNDTKETKEIPSNDFVTEKEVKACKISKLRQRRKSMPLLNRGDIKFSSDEEQEDKTDNIRDHRFRRKSPIREVIDRRYDRDRNNRYGSKEHPFCATEMTRGEDKFHSHRDSVRDNYYKSNSRYNDNDWQKRPDPRDRYDTRSKNRLSHDRYRFNTRREFSNDQPQRFDYGRHRVTVSSPPEKHSSLRKSRDADRYRFQNEEAYGYKHKIHEATDEPSHKRLRTESPKMQQDERVMLQNEGNGLFTTVSVPQLIPYSSLQSPDYNALDPHPAHKIKEIKGTATSKLDDPRLKSNKYLHNTHNDKVVLTTVVGRNIELKRIDKDVWGVDKHIQKMPTPLRERPEISEDFVNRVYMDINNPISNMSLESGELVCEDSDDLKLTNLDNADKNSNKIKTNAVGTNTLNVQRDKPELNKLQSQNESKITKTQTETSDIVGRKWRIPLKSKPKSKPSDELSTNKKNEEHKHDSIEQSCKKNSQEKPLKLNSNNRRSSKIIKDHLPELGPEEHYVKKQIVSVKDTVEDDLELSDETSDCTEFVDQTRYSKEKSEECTREPVIVRIPKDKLKEHGSDGTHNKQGVFQHEIEKLCKKKNDDILKFDTNTKPKEQIKQKELKLNKDIKEDIKAKICDLFGDSNSLITPDDLGFVEQPTVNPVTNKYSPLFDNTQDAVDLNVEEMEKVQTRSSKIKHDEAGASSNQHDEKQDKKQKSKSSKINNERKKKPKNIPDKTSGIEPNIENLKELNEEPNVLKTVIISTGVQNSCQNVDPMFVKGQEKLPNTLSLPNLKALATSTPHKISQIEPTWPIPESNCSANNNVSTNSSSVKSNIEDDNISKTNQNNLDVPEFRIVVKRRRKARAPN